jgi:hypothetical protein
VASREETTVAINPVVAEHLKEARRVLVTQRDALNHDIAQLDRMLAGAGGEHNDAPTTGTAPAPSLGPAPAMRDAIRDHLLSEERAFSTNEVAVALKEKYGWELSSTRSQLAKMGKSGEVVAVRRGVYRAARPEDTSGPDESGPEAGVPTSGPGGDPHAQADRDHGDGPFDRADHRDDRGGAPVGASPS